MTAVGDKIQGRSIHNQHRKIVLLGKKCKIALPDFFQVFGIYGLLIIPASFPYVNKELFFREVQVDKKIRFGKSFINDVKKIPVEIVFILRQRILGKNE